VALGGDVQRGHVRELGHGLRRAQVPQNVR
jgi:hypothetical protein